MRDFVNLYKYHPKTEHIEEIEEIEEVAKTKKSHRIKSPKQRLRRRLLLEQNKKCGICGMKIKHSLDYRRIYNASIDHIIPKSKGGTDNFSNLSLVHKECNHRKADKIFPICWINY